VNLTDPKTIKKVLENHSIFLSKKLGQNFLINEKSLEKIIENASLSKNDTVVEIGSGIGSLTIPLSRKVKKLITVEKDNKLIPLLEKNINKKNNITVINDDILDLNFFDKNNLAKPPFFKKKTNYKIIANIPYYITSPIIRKFLEKEHPPKFLLLMIQKEVAQRICSSPPNMSLLSVSVQFFAKPQILFDVSKSSFFPRPKVDSSVIKIIPFKESYSSVFCDCFFDVVRKGFSHPRKQIGKNLSLLDKESRKRIQLKKSEIIKKIKESNIDPKRRAETLSVKEWVILTKKLCLKK